MGGGVLGERKKRGKRNQRGEKRKSEGKKKGASERMQLHNYHTLSEDTRTNGKEDKSSLKGEEREQGGGSTREQIDVWLRIDVFMYLLARRVVGVLLRWNTIHESSSPLLDLPPSLSPTPTSLPPRSLLFFPLSAGSDPVRVKIAEDRSLLDLGPSPPISAAPLLLEQIC
eukprot:scaffold100121_cov23-Tisochrysis_lutea.AAC.1